MMRFSVILISCLLGGCSAWPTGSYVQSVSELDAATLAPAIVDYLSSTLPSGSAVAVAASQQDNLIAPVLSTDLDHAGIAQSVVGTSVRYVVAPLDSGILLRIVVGDNQGATRYYARQSNGALLPASPLMVVKP